MQQYKYDYSHKTIKKTNNTYFIKVNTKYIKINKAIFKVLKSSYDRIRYTYKKEVAESVIYYDDIDSATFFVAKKEEKSLAEKIYIHDLYIKVIMEINKLPERDRNIAYLCFIGEYNNSEVSRILNIPRTTVNYRKKKIREKIIKKLSLWFALFTYMSERRCHDDI